MQTRKMQISLDMTSKIEVDVILPASKSISNRTLLIKALCPAQRHVIGNLAECDDTDHMLKAIADKGAGASLIDIGATGTAMRFLTAYLAIAEGETILTGSERMQHRPIGTLVEALRKLGADIFYIDKEGYPPLRICGRELSGGELEIEAGISSQYISALLMIGPCMAQGLTLQLRGEIASRTYIELTLALMRHYGAKAEWIDEQSIRVEQGSYEDRPLMVEGDWSAASYWYELAAIAAYCGHEVEVMLRGLTADSRQGDRVVADMFVPLGVVSEFNVEGVVLRAYPVLDATCATPDMHLDFAHCPDIAQTLAVTCCMLNRPFVFTGVRSLRIKETDRMAALIAELRKLGYVLRADGDERLIWDGERCAPMPNATITTYDDHRMAMSFAPAALCYKELVIEHPEVVSKSYPRFWDDLNRLRTEYLTNR